MSQTEIEAEQAAEQFVATFHRIRDEVGKFIVGQQTIIEEVLLAVVSGGHVLPEAQLDRFFFKLFVDLPNHEEFGQILDRTGGTHEPEIDVVAHGEDLLRMGRTLREIPIDSPVQDHLIRIVRGTHPENDDATEDVRKYVRHGASPRGAQTILAASRGRALLAGRYHVSRDDVNSVATAALRHRIILSFEGEAEGVRPDAIIGDVVKTLE